MNTLIASNPLLVMVAVIVLVALTLLNTMDPRRAVDLRLLRRSRESARRWTARACRDFLATHDPPTRRSGPDPFLPRLGPAKATRKIGIHYDPPRAIVRG